MRNFDLLVKFIWEKQKVRLDPKCWKGKKLGNPKTKMKGGVRVNNCVPAESIKESTEYKASNSFADLPPAAPHGFWVTNDGRFIVIPGIFGHIEALEKLFKIYKDSVALDKGFVKISKPYPGTYELIYSPLHASRSSVKLAKDIAAFYNATVIDHFEKY